MTYFRIMMKLGSGLLNLTETERRKEIYRLFSEEPKRTYNIILSEIGSSVFNREITYHEVCSNPEDLDRFNIELLKIRGYGDTKLHKFDTLDYSLDMSHFHSLFDYDKAFEENQFKLELELARDQKNQKRIEMFENASYKFRLRRDFYAQLRDDDLIESVNVISALEHIINELSNKLHEINEGLYPSKVRYLKEGETPSGILGARGKVRDYFGKESYSDELKRRCFQYIYSDELREEIRIKTEELPVGVVYKRCEDAFDSKYSFSSDLIVLNARAAKSIRFSDFNQDINALNTDERHLQTTLAFFLNKLNAVIEEIYNDIEANFEPGKVERIKPIKVICSDSFIEDLENLERIFKKDNNDE